MTFFEVVLLLSMVSCRAYMCNCKSSMELDEILESSFKNHVHSI